MTIRTKILAAIFSLIASKHSLAATTLTGIAGAYFATQLGFDPWPWVLGILGGVIVRVKLPPTSRIDGLVNGVISVTLAGVFAPWCAILLDDLMGSKIAPNEYVLAFALACLWPWVVNFFHKRAGDVFDGLMKKWGLK